MMTQEKISARMRVEEKQNEKRAFRKKMGMHVPKKKPSRVDAMVFQLLLDHSACFWRGKRAYFSPQEPADIFNTYETHPRKFWWYEHIVRHCKSAERYTICIAGCSNTIKCRRSGYQATWYPIVVYVKTKEVVAGESCYGHHVFGQWWVFYFDRVYRF